MRKGEYELNDPEEFERIIQNGEVGYLGILTPDGFPRVVPVNYVFSQGYLYFHGAPAGEKFSVFKTNPKVSFTVAIPYSIIPSYWLGTENACPITIFYHCVAIRGYGEITDTLEEKAMALQMLMEKYQPEGGYRPISPDEASYQKILEKTAVFRIKPSQTSIKVHFGQNLSAQAKQELIRRLEERDQRMDRKTAEELRKTL